MDYTELQLQWFTVFIIHNPDSRAAQEEWRTFENSKKASDALVASVPLDVIATDIDLNSSTSPTTITPILVSGRWSASRQQSQQQKVTNHVPADIHALVGARYRANEKAKQQADMNWWDR